MQVSFNGSDIAVPFNTEILEWANKTRELLSSAEVPNQIKFYNIYGTNNETPHCVWYLKLLQSFEHKSACLKYSRMWA